MDPPAVPGLPTGLNLIRAIRFPIKMIILWKSDPCCDRNKLSSDIGETLPAPWEPFRSRRELDFIRGAIKPDPRPYATTTKLETKSMLSIIAVEPLERPKQTQAVGYYYTFNLDQNWQVDILLPETKTSPLSRKRIALYCENIAPLVYFARLHQKFLCWDTERKGRTLQKHCDW